MLSQTTNSILMIRPSSFGFNEETAVSNEYQQKVDLSESQVLSRVQKEFDETVDILRDNGINVIVVEDTPKPEKPDAIFPNNWISMHHDGRIILYPMKTSNRRIERRMDIVDEISKSFYVKDILDESAAWENRNMAMEGTGSLVFDHDNRIAYASLSQRTEREAVLYFCELLGYTPCIFSSFTSNNKPQYHTNVVMSVASDFVLIGLDSIKDRTEQSMVKKTVLSSGKELIPLTQKQLEKSFCGNTLQLENKDGVKILVMSDTALSGFSEEQLDTIQSFTEIISVPISLIEKIGGGSARCMMAEIFLSTKN